MMAACVIRFEFAAWLQKGEIETSGTLAFQDERDWLQFHNPKDIAAAIAIVAA